MHLVRFARLISSAAAAAIAIASPAFKPTMSEIHCATIAPYATPLSVQITQYATTGHKDTTSLDVLISPINNISMQPGTIDQKQYMCALSIAHACHVIEGCHKDAKPRRLPVPPMLCLLVEKMVRCASRVVGAERDERATATIFSYGRYAKIRHSFERSVGMLRREVARPSREVDLELKYSRSRGTFRTSAEDLRYASRYGRSEVASFVHAVCYAVTREVGVFPLPLPTLNSGPFTSRWSGRGGARRGGRLSVRRFWGNWG